MAYPIYPPYQPYYPQGFQPVMQQPVQPQNQAPSTTGILWVSGLAEAQAFPVCANSAVALWENSGKTVFLKSSDATGKPSLRIYDLVERTESADTGIGRSDEKTLDYATKSDIEAITETVRKALEDIDQMKGDLYGVAGRKKPAKKEASDDDA